MSGFPSCVAGILMIAYNTGGPGLVWPPASLCLFGWRCDWDRTDGGRGEVRGWRGQSDAKVDCAQARCGLRGWVDGRWSTRTGVGNQTWAREMSGSWSRSSPFSSAFRAGDPQGLAPHLGAEVGWGGCLDIGMGPCFGAGSCLRPLHPGPGQSPQPCSARFMGGGADSFIFAL